MPATLKGRQGTATMARRKKIETFADRLHAVRTEAGISQYRLAKLSGLTKQAVSLLELGRVQPTWETVQALARALNVSCEAFVVSPPPVPPTE